MQVRNSLVQRYSETKYRMKTSFLGLNDILFAPVYLTSIVLISLIITRKYIREDFKRKYFVSGLTTRILSSVAIGLIYQFYYGYGDNIAYFKDSLILTNICYQHPGSFLDLFLLRSGEHIPEVSTQIYQIYFYRDPAGYFVVKLAAFMNLFSWSSYICTSILFALIGFSGSWAFFITLLKINNRIPKQLAIASFFVPSVVLWSSGILKDTVTYAALCWMFYSFYCVINEGQFRIKHILIILVSGYILYVVKIYILMCFMPCLLIWSYFLFQKKIQSRTMKIISQPLLAIACILGAVYGTAVIAEDNSRYSLDKISETSEITARYIYITTLNDGGTPYSLGEIEYTIPGLIKVFPAAVNVTLFRPYLWEVRKVFPFLAAVESLWTLFLTLQVLNLARFNLFKIMREDNYVIFAILFSILFAFAIGISSFNFGALHRYKIPLMSFYISALYIIGYYAKRIKYAD